MSALPRNYYSYTCISSNAVSLHTLIVHLSSPFPRHCLRVPLHVVLDLHKGLTAPLGHWVASPPPVDGSLGFCFAGFEELILGIDGASPSQQQQAAAGENSNRFSTRGGLVDRRTQPGRCSTLFNSANLTKLHQPSLLRPCVERHSPQHMRLRIYCALMPA